MGNLIGIRTEPNGLLTAIFIQDKYTIEVYGILPEKLSINISECGGGGAGGDGGYKRTYGGGGGYG